jgi:large subunit ribosomal protein L4
MTITDTVNRGPVKKDRAAPITRTATRRNIAGHDLGKVDLEPSIFGLEPNRAVLHQVITAQLAAIRSGTQSTKTRSEVRGGGAKPFSQKGTGRARQGSSRSPSMSGGGVALGPKPRSYRQHTPKKMIRLALLSALSDRAAIERVALVDDWGWEAPKTKDAAVALRKLRITGSVLVVLDTEEVAALRSFHNLPNVKTTTYAELSAHDVIRHDWILFSDRTLPGSAETATETATESATEAATEAPAPKAKAAAKTTKATSTKATTPKAETPKTAAAKAEAAPVTDEPADAVETEEADTDA